LNAPPPAQPSLEEWKNSASGEFWVKALQVLRRFKRQKTLYHYTSLAGLLGILQSKELWLSSIRYMNDASEMSLGHERFREVCEEFKAKRNPGPRFQELLDTLLRLGDADIQMDAFIFCLCEEKDLLSQWRGYAEGGGGVAIEFKARSILPPQQGLALQPVLYSGWAQREILETLLKVFRKHLNKLDASGDPQKKRGLLNDACNAFAMTLPLVKNDAFREEKEWRLLKVTHRSLQELRVSHRVSNGLVVPYMRLPLADPLPIESIVVGPSAHQDLLAEGIKDLLHRVGASSVKVELSSTPYRAR
jgi:hypothetical protein